MLTLQAASPEQQEALGGVLAGSLTPPFIVYLQGDLGAGKTTLVRGLLRAMGYAGAVRSPTYTLMEPYDVGCCTVWHLDLYRLGDPEELEYLGLRDLLDGQSILLIEWPERGRGVLPGADLVIHITHREGGRRLEFEPLSARGRRVAGQLANRLQEEVNG